MNLDSSQVVGSLWDHKKASDPTVNFIISIRSLERCMGINSWSFELKILHHHACVWQKFQEYVQPLKLYKAKEIIPIASPKNVSNLKWAQVTSIHESTFVHPFQYLLKLFFKQLNGRGPTRRSVCWAHKKGLSDKRLPGWPFLGGNWSQLQRIFKVFTYSFLPPHGIWNKRWAQHETRKKLNQKHLKQSSKNHFDMEVVSPYIKLPFWSETCLTMRIWSKQKRRDPKKDDLSSRKTDFVHQNWLGPPLVEPKKLESIGILEYMYLFFNLNI